MPKTPKFETEPTAAAPAAKAPSPGSVSIEVPLATAAAGKYMSGRCDTDLTQMERSICRRIQDAIEASGKPCKGPSSVFKHLLALVAAGLPRG